MDPFELTERRGLPVNIRSVQDSNIVPDTTLFLLLIFIFSSESEQANFWIMPHIRPRPLLPTLFTNHETYLLFMVYGLSYLKR